MTVKPNSWHFRLASLYGRGEFFHRTNLCSYFWRFCWGLIMCAFLVSVSVGASYILLMVPAFWIVLCVVDWHVYPMEEAIAGFIFWGMAVVIVGLFAYALWRQEKQKPLLPIPSPIREAYRGWKDKYCPVVEIAE